MWFKNIKIYRLTQGFTHSPEQLAEKMADHRFKPCGSQDLVKLGWSNPLKHHGSELVHSLSGNTMLCVKKQEKLLPASVINEHLEAKALEIQTQEQRSVGRSERQNLKEEIVMALLPKALTRSKLNYVYIAAEDDLIVFNNTSSKLCEEVLSLLRDALGSLPVVPLATKKPPSPAMTTWLKNGKAPKGFELGSECELEAPKDEGRIIRCKNQDLLAAEFQSHLDTDMVVRKLALKWQDKIEFILDQDLNIKRLKFSDELLEKAGERDAETYAEEFDADFALMSAELRLLFKDLLSALGGSANMD